MWKHLATTAAAAGLCIAVAGNADAQRTSVGMQGRASVNANAGVTHSSRMTASHTRASMTARAQARGPHFTPSGWSHGRKIGWNCRVGTRGCIPPGLR